MRIENHLQHLCPWVAERAAVFAQWVLWLVTPTPPAVRKFFATVRSRDFMEQLIEEVRKSTIEQFPRVIEEFDLAGRYLGECIQKREFPVETQGALPFKWMKIALACESQTVWNATFGGFVGRVVLERQKIDERIDLDNSFRAYLCSVDDLLRIQLTFMHTLQHATADLSLEFSHTFDVDPQGGIVSLGETNGRCV